MTASIVHNYVIVGNIIIHFFIVIFIVRPTVRIPLAPAIKNYLC